MKAKTIYLENIDCPLCNSDDFNVEFDREDLNAKIPGRYCVVRCNVCDHMFLNPRPTTYSIKNQLYTDDYDQYQSGNSKLGLKNLLQSYGLHKRYKLITKHVSSGRILDVGCASGEFLKYMKKFSEWSLVGLEPISQAANISRDKLDIEIINNTLDEHNFNEEKFDVVTFWHVFEHVEDPIKTLHIVEKILNHEGIIVLTLPIMNSIDHWIFGKYWIGFELPRHLHFFSKEKMLELLSCSGYEFLESRCFYGSHAMTMTSLKFWLRSRNSIPDKVINGLFNLLMSIPVRLLLAPFYLLFDSLQISTPVTFVAKKCEK